MIPANIPGYGSAKINAALNYGGIFLQVATVENLLGIKIDHVAEIEFEGFKALVNSVNGGCPGTFRLRYQCVVFARYAAYGWWCGFCVRSCSLPVR